jgi:solute carrier family 25 phosphate transporter 23/24/25/41
VSRTSTAPFDRLKIFLITRPQDVAIAPTTRFSGLGVKAITGAIARIYAEGGLLAFWVGNGLAVAKIFPESAIKFYSYESSVSRSVVSVLGLPFGAVATETPLRQVL